eukprot:3869533-Rhodomonas_salina.1
MAKAKPFVLNPQDLRWRTDTACLCSLQLTHWSGNETPAEYKADLSTEIAFRWLKLLDSNPKQQAHYENAVVLNNHCDTDGIMSIWALLNPEKALDYEDIMVKAAAAGVLVQNNNAFSRSPRSSPICSLGRRFFGMGADVRPRNATGHCVHKAHRQGRQRQGRIRPNPSAGRGAAHNDQPPQGPVGGGDGGARLAAGRCARRPHQDQPPPRQCCPTPHAPLPSPHGPFFSPHAPLRLHTPPSVPWRV